MSDTSSTSVDDDLRADTDYWKAVLRSLENEQSEDAVAEKDRARKALKALKKKREDMYPSQSMPYWGYSDPTQQTSSAPFSTLHPHPWQANDSTESALLPDYPSSASLGHVTGMMDSNRMATSTTNLPNRKRPLSGYTESLPQPKSQKPVHVQGASDPAPAAWHGFDNFDSEFTWDPEFETVFGDGWPPAGRETQTNHLRAIEERKLQEDEDREFARQLQETWNGELGHTSNKPKPVIPTASNFVQSSFNPDGSWQDPMSQAAWPQVKTEGRPVITVDDPPSGASSTATDDSSGLEEISAADWNQTVQRVVKQRGVSGPASTSYSTMPGAFPGSSSQLSQGATGHVYSGGKLAAGGLDIDWDGASNNYSYLNTALSLFGVDTASLPYSLDDFDSPGMSPQYPWYVDSQQTKADIKDLLKHIRPDEDLSEEQLREVQPEGLRINLMPHQRKGFAWMKSMEEGTNKGGILGDDMGLGKTVQAISLILARRPESGQQKPTLVVAPVALMRQWEREFQKFIAPSHALKVMILHQGNRNQHWEAIRRFDVVLTTYGTLASDFKRKIAWNKYLEVVPDAKPTPQQRLPLLGDNAHFHRVVLDEAQNIKNRQTKTAVAAYHIKADYRWCLSGTPMQNNVDEIHSLIKFCRIKPYHEWEKFSKDIARPLKRTTDYGKENAMKKLQAILKAICLRRTKKSEIDGKPILQLPEKHVVEDRAIFSPDEKEFYKQLESQAQIQFNRYLKEGTVGRHYSHALVLLLRLRQCCCSPQLVTNAKDFMTNGTLNVNDRLENARLLPTDTVRRLDQSDPRDCPICLDVVENPVIFNPCGHSLCTECLAAMTDKILNDNDPKLLCPHCRAVVDPQKVTDLESYVRVHHPERVTSDVVDRDTEDNEDSDSEDEEEDDDDDDYGEDLKDFIVPDDEDEEWDTDDKKDEVKNSISKSIKRDDEDEDDVESRKLAKRSQTNRPKDKGKGKGKGKGKEKAKQKIVSLAELRKEGLKNKAAKKRYLKRLAKGYEPSAKIEKTIEILHEIRSHGQGEKTIVFSSFTSFLDLLEVPLNEDEDLAQYARYDGSMKAQDRNDAVMEFTDNPRCKIMLVSIKAGNAGLNLTAANHVIILDPFWNPFVEYQAADRCYRIGQRREVTVHRVLIGADPADNNEPPRPDGTTRDYTVEDRILALQEKKKALVETALDETAASSLGRLTTQDLGFLFGVNDMD